MDSVNECARDVPNMNVVPFEMRFKQHDCPVVNGAIYEIIDQQIDSHSGRHTEYRRETKTVPVPASEYGFPGLPFSAAMERDWLQGGVLGAKLAFFPDAVPPVGDRHLHSLFASR